MKRMGLRLVDDYSEIKSKLTELKVKLVKYARQFEIEVIPGYNKIAKVKEIERCSISGDREELNSLRS